MTLPLVDVFKSNYEYWLYREPTHDEMMAHFQKTGHFPTCVNDHLIRKVSNAVDAAIHIASVGADNGLDRFINDALNADLNHKAWRRSMPSRTPQAISAYQKSFPSYDPVQVDSSINGIGEPLSNGQFLFHGGLWPRWASSVFKTPRPFSTSFCPQVALRNAEHNGKAYDNGQIDLFVLRATNPITNVFSFRRAGTNLGHENEVLFASGATLTLKSRSLIRGNYPAGKGIIPNKHVDIYVLEVDIS